MAEVGGIYAEEFKQFNSVTYYIYIYSYQPLLETEVVQIIVLSSWSHIALAVHGLDADIVVFTVRIYGEPS